MYIPFVNEYLRENNSIYGTHLFIYEFFALYKKCRGDLRILESEILKKRITRLDKFLIYLASIKFANFIKNIFIIVLKVGY